MIREALILGLCIIAAALIISVTMINQPPPTITVPQVAVNPNGGGNMGLPPDWKERGINPGTGHAGGNPGNTLVGPPTEPTK